MTSQDHEAWSSFERLVKEAQIQDVDAAWELFRRGWEAHVSKMKAAATDWWCNYNG